MRFSRIQLGLGVSGVVVGLIVVATVLGWSSSRFNRISVCVTCHEIYVDYDEYKPVGALSESLEDHNPSKAPDPGLFNVTVGCAECHAYPFEEYRDSPHYYNDLGVRPGCVGCHDPHSVRQVLAWKFFYVNTGGLGESAFHAISNSLRDTAKWEALRVTLAARVRKQMVDEDSVKCKVCHEPESKWFKKIKRHKSTEGDEGKTCVQCHYNLVHAEVPWEKADQQ